MEKKATGKKVAAKTVKTVQKASVKKKSAPVARPAEKALPRRKAARTKSLVKTTKPGVKSKKPAAGSISKAVPKKKTAVLRKKTTEQPPLKTQKKQAVKTSSLKKTAKTKPVITATKKRVVTPAVKPAKKTVAVKKKIAKKEEPAKKASLKRRLPAASEKVKAKASAGVATKRRKPAGKPPLVLPERKATAPASPVTAEKEMPVKQQVAAPGSPAVTEPRRHEKKETVKPHGVGMPAEKISSPAPLELLPYEYGVNYINLMIVDPGKIFAFWEIQADTLAIFGSNLHLRVYDTTGCMDSECLEANLFFDIAVSDRMGSWYCQVYPERNYIADIGILYEEGIFITLARSNWISTPPGVLAEGGEFPEGLAGTTIPVGYSG